MLLLVFSALAGPPLPQLSARGAAVALAASAEAGTDTLIDADCPADGNCSALRHRAGWGGTLGAQVTPFLSAWLHVGTETVEVAQAEFNGEGFGGEAGVNLSLRPARPVGALVWAGGTYGYAATEGTSTARRWGVRAGGAARFGVPDDEFVSWVGGELAATAVDETSVLAGELDLAMTAPVPANLVAGFTMFSAPLAGPGSEGPRMFLASDVSLGAENGLRLSLGAAF